ncbi:hypothetical protein [Vagococcus lutrae]|uniref:hypothetical protein n=1 Tax=Vagococcus lutrae TaxID=81947 RepID=UPI0020109D9C|nr:hypothetical protein [Vagococcus lutrae]MDT2841752.1 hypothetical protein [Vagococcus lutrae]UQF11234.1 hypothetical protein M2919_06995 [Vagococcus lutrae]
MIYNKDASFPYPILSRTSTSYENNYFDFSITDVKEDSDHFIFNFSYEIGSPFIEKMLKENKATLVIIVQSNDNYFKRIGIDETELILNKNRFSLSKRTKIQLHIQTLEDISFSEADDLNDFYKEFRNQIVVERHSLLGYSDEAVLEHSDIKPLELFEQSIRSDLPVPFKVELTNEMIVLVFRSKEESLEVSGLKPSIRNMYLYIGLSRALKDILETYGKDEEFVQIESIQMPENGLHMKLCELMLSKNITELSDDRIDEVIQMMADDIVEKYVHSVKEMSENGH